MRCSTEFSKKMCVCVDVCTFYFSDYRLEYIRFHIYASTYDELLCTRVELMLICANLFKAQTLNCKTLPPSRCCCYYLDVRISLVCP